ncbi:adenosine/AMP deaminase [Colletotrichum abscissum]|uniref:adenosine deaminase n=1 Tax=Colletotrichum abscissum TaxID=1671311 RepID=A0A9P9X250_9PEZI|nr:adenosine/AMP deaminase [Colletotrichum abscissum]KAI3532580.1 adenosine/AMP deaminase [Colletotrichum abscissum]KAK1514842.1 adenosine/AMP deaminase [Colletotrichum abscissum]
MGSLCSNIEKDDAPGEKDGQASRDINAKTITRLSSKRLRKLRHQRHHAHHQRHQADMDKAQGMIEAHEVVINNIFKMHRKPALDKMDARKIDGPDEYFHQRKEILDRENTLSFDFSAKMRASEKERKANAIIQKLKVKDHESVYEPAEKRQGWGGQKHARFAADHFLSNVDLINQTSLFRVAVKMPKGAHLHIHFNACLQPHVLLGIAETMPRMFIKSDLSLAPSAAKTNLHRCEIQFSILPLEKEDEVKGNLFKTDYHHRQMMKYSEFIKEFPKHYNGMKAEEWLTSKLVFHEDEAHNALQTVQGAWEKFNGRTRMMKGLFNYESAYRKYTRGILEDFVRDNIQYAEIRPNFMQTNQLWTDDGTRQIDNRGIMKIIIEEYDNFQKETKDYFGGLKVIYCTPRSFTTELVAFALDECFEFKREWPQWIAGFDLVGEESQGHPLRHFVTEFLAFRKRCEESQPKVDIPFLFHCGETTDIGNDTDGNLVDALLLNSKRIGHGFALARHPYIMEHMKKRGICLEVCPISNEELGLTPRITGHAMYNLLANNVHCTLNSDNGTIFRSTLSHDFYQAMVGKTDMTLHGWRQLIEWSLEHSCMSKDELASVRKEWEKRWELFLEWILEEFRDLSLEIPE